jgi:hypothetical protein
MHDFAHGLGNGCGASPGADDRGAADGAPAAVPTTGRLIQPRHRLPPAAAPPMKPGTMAGMSPTVCPTASSTLPSRPACWGSTVSGLPPRASRPATDICIPASSISRGLVRFVDSRDWPRASGRSDAGWLPPHPNRRLSLRLGELGGLKLCGLLRAPCICFVGVETSAQKFSVFHLAGGYRGLTCYAGAAHLPPVRFR